MRLLLVNVEIERICVYKILNNNPLSALAVLHGITHTVALGITYYFRLTGWLVLFCARQ